MSLSAHLVGDYERSHHTREQNIVQSGAMEYNALAHGHAAPNAQQIAGFSQFSQASIAPAYAGDTAGPSNMPLTRLDGPLTFQQIQALQQQRDEAQALRTAQQIAKLQAKLNQKLGPEYISQRPGPGGGPKLTYAEGWKMINLANEVFGFNGWSSSITSLTTDYIDYNQETQRYNVGVTAIVRVFLRDGVSHEDIGYGLLENCKSKGMAIDKCKKEAVTDAIKRTLRNFGNVLGNCLYDKEYTKEILKMKMPVPPKMEAKDLHRRKEFAEGQATASTSGMNKPHPPMAPPPAPTRPAQQPPAQPPSRPMDPKPSVSTSTSSTVQRIADALAGSTSSTSAVPPPQSRPSTTVPPSPVPGPSRPNVSTTTPATIKRTTTDEAMYTFGSDDEFADFSFSASDVELAAELTNGNVTADFTDHSVGGVDFTNRSRILPSALSTFDPTPRPVKPLVDVSENPQSASTSRAGGPRKMSAETKNKILEGLLNSETPSSAQPAPIRAPGSTSAAVGITTSTQSKRSSSGGGFAIPPGVSRPQRTSYPHPQALNGTSKASGAVVSHFPSGASGIGNKRTSETVGLAGFGGGGIPSARSVLGELDVQRDGSVKRPRLS